MPVNRHFPRYLQRSNIQVWVYRLNLLHHVPMQPSNWNPIRLKEQFQLGHPPLNGLGLNRLGCLAIERRWSKDSNFRLELHEVSNI